jgi:exonuclease SbcC
LVVAAASAASTADASGRAADEAKTAEATAQAAAAEQQESLVRRREELRRGAGEVAADEQGIHEALKILPAPLRLPDRPAPNDLTEPLALLDTLEIENAERDAALAVARSRVRHLERQRQVIEARRRSEADLPLARYRERMARVAAAVERAEASAGTAVRVTLDGAEPSVIESRANAIAGVLSARARALEVRRVKIGAERSGTLSAHGVVSRDEVVERAQEATGDRAVADADRDRAEGQIRQAAHLEKRIGDGGDLVDAVTELARLLADGQFLSYVVETRQRALLGIASTILTEMSGGRYGFSHDFQIVDQTSGQPRSPKTLSGGESFQASLALALGLVELAGRSGGRLSSLFLDEGFGTLDANALDEALEELERRAASGRVIGVITHLRSVADRIENVLLVDKDLGRTQVRWLNGNERERMTSDDLAHITALTG